MWRKARLLQFICNSFAITYLNSKGIVKIHNVKNIPDKKVKKDWITNLQDILEKLTSKMMTQPKIAWIYQNLFGVDQKFGCVQKAHSLLR